MKVSEILAGYQKQETRTGTPADFRERWLPQEEAPAGADPEARALLLGFCAGFAAARDGGDMPIPAEMLEDLLADYREALASGLPF